MVGEADVLSAIDFAHQLIRKQVEAQEKLVTMFGVEKIEFTPPEKNQRLIELIKKETTSELKLESTTLLTHDSQLKTYD